MGDTYCFTHQRFHTADEWQEGVCTWRSSKKTFSLEKFQAEVDEWTRKNFPGEEPVWTTLGPVWTTLGIVEEVGELAHALLKQHQGIRGSYDEHERAAKDAVGDLLVYAAHLCNEKGWSLQEIVSDTWEHVKGRDWTKDAVKGQTGTLSEPQKRREPDWTGDAYHGTH